MYIAIRYKAELAVATQKTYETFESFTSEQVFWPPIPKKLRNAEANAKLCTPIPYFLTVDPELFWTSRLQKLLYQDTRVLDKKNGNTPQQKKSIVPV